MPSESACAGKLFVVATPIGNMEDVSLRALRVLAEVDLIAAEDTRRTQKLLSRYDIHARVTAYHEANSERATPQLLERLAQGQTIALVTDAGTPGVSDPGSDLVSGALDIGALVSPIPGASALSAALSICGFDTRRVCVLGFLPKRKSEREGVLMGLADDPSTVVLFDSPRRALDSLELIARVLPDRRVVLLRELTKAFEEVLRGSASDVRDALAARDKVLGEITLVMEGHARSDVNDADSHTEALRAALLRAISSGLDKRAAIQAVASILEVRKSDVYDIAVDL